jgi:hypothetical protein
LKNGATPQHSFESPINRKEYNTQSKICISHTHDGIIFDDTPSTIVTNIPTRHSHKSNVSSTNSSTHILSPSFFVIFLVCFALCFHSVTEGIVIGLLSDSMSIWIATLSVCGHKCVASFSLAANCLQNQVVCSFFFTSYPINKFIVIILFFVEKKHFHFVFNYFFTLFSFWCPHWSSKLYARFIFFFMLFHSQKKNQMLPFRFQNFHLH